MKNINNITEKPEDVKFVSVNRVAGIIILTLHSKKAKIYPLNKENEKKANYITNNLK